MYVDLFVDFIKKDKKTTQMKRNVEPGKFLANVL